MPGALFVMYFLSACTPEGSRKANLEVFQTAAGNTFHLSTVPPGESPTLVLTVIRLADEERRTASTPLTAVGDGTFRLPLLSDANPEAPPYWYMFPPPFLPDQSEYNAELIFELEASWLPPEERPAFDFLVHDDEWANYLEERSVWDYEEVCLWFNWCLLLNIGYDEIP